jgi:hypothetical protein
MRHSCPSEIKRAQGRPGGWPHPWPASNKKSWRQSPQVQPINRPSLRNGFNGVLRALLGDRAFLPPSLACVRNACELGLSVGRPGPHDFAVRRGIARPATPLRPSHPALYVRDDASAPPDEHGTAQDNHTLLKNGSRIFFARGLDGRISSASPCEHSIFRTRDVGERERRDERRGIENESGDGPSGESLALKGTL